MSRIHLHAAKYLFLLFLCLLTGCGETGEQEKKATREIFAMDTIMQLTVYGDNGEEAITEAARFIQLLDRLFSVTQNGSDISKINSAKGKPVIVAKETYELIQRSKEYSEQTGGVFDISTYPLVKAWGFTKEKQRVPSKAAREEAVEKIDYRKIHCLPEYQIQLEAGMEIDLGAVAKGYAAQNIIDMWKKRGVTSAILSLGGNVQTIGRKSDGSQYEVGITNPQDGTSLYGSLSVEDKAVVTSGIYQRNFEEDGVLYHHIMDVSTGMPADNTLASVTVIGNDGTEADALATALFVMGEEKIKEYQKNHPQIQVLIIRKDGTFWQSGKIRLSRK